MGYGFHEDGLKAGLRAAHELIVAHELLPTRSAAQVRQAALPGVFG
jgi:predicted NAD/FAD-binding protein